LGDLLAIVRPSTHGNAPFLTHGRNDVSTRRIAAVSVALALIITGMSASPAHATHELVRGFVTDGVTGEELSGVCVAMSPPTCTMLTDRAGMYQIHLADGAPRTVELVFSLTGYQTARSEPFVVSGHVDFYQVLMPTAAPPLCPAPRPDSPTQTAYLANVTKNLWGYGWNTPFIVQNSGTADATLEVTFYRFVNGACAVRRTITGLRPGTSFADVPNNDVDLPSQTQFSVVVRSFGSTVVSVVNEHAGLAPNARALSYVGATSGATSVFVPNVTRRFFGYVTPIIIQNLGTSEADVTVAFTSFDGTAPDATVTRRIPVGGSKFIDPNSEAGLVDGKQYTARVTSGQPVSAVVNTHYEEPGHAVGYATNGITAGAQTVYGPYAAKHAGAEGWVSTIVVHNVGQVSVTPSLQFDPLGGTGAAQVVSAPAPVAPGRAWAFDPRFTFGTTTPCTTQGPTCLGDGEYSFVARSNDANAQIAVAVNVIGTRSAMGYTAIPTPTSRVYLPNVTRMLGRAGAFTTPGWTTPVLLQAVGTDATGATLRWYRFSDGVLEHTQDVAIRSGTAVRIDPRSVSQLRDGTQYAVVVDGTGGSVAAVVTQLAPGDDGAMTYVGDGAMIYEGLSSP
jgi:hypothetical protein